MTEDKTSKISLEEFRKRVLDDFRLACLSREASLLGRKEVLTGKAKFGIFGDGKEVAQIALAKAFRRGDWRSGYYRDQTWMMALGVLSVEEFFAQLYANTNPDEEPMSAGRQMNGHYITRLQDANGKLLNQTERYNSSADASPTGSQMPRSLGLALASKLYRSNSDLEETPFFSNHGNEVSFVSIGDASTSEGIFWEALNAAGVMQVPLAVSVWDDGYGISVPKKYQTTKESISELVKGFQKGDADHSGIDIYTCEGWNYPKLIETYKNGIEKVRQTHTPALFHITEVTQPQGHSTSGSHERYKSAERLQWEKDFDCIKKMQEWIVASSIASQETCQQIAEEARQAVLQSKNSAWRRYTAPIKSELHELVEKLENVSRETGDDTGNTAAAQLRSLRDPIRKDLLKTGKALLRRQRENRTAALENLRRWLADYEQNYQEVYSANLYSESTENALKVPVVPAEYIGVEKILNGFEIINTFFAEAFKKYPYLVAFGEDVGKIGDVNQGFAGLQEQFGENRVFDTGIREATIIGQGIGLALRGIRPIAEIQYLDYLLFGLQPLADDLCSLQYRTKGAQKAPMIVRTRGHRLEGIWHTGSPLGMIVNALRGMYVCVPRNMVQAAGMYNTLLQSDEPALVIECLNGYRLKEKLPSNIGAFTVPLGVPEILREGSDVTLVTYGSCVRIAEEAIAQLTETGISVELIDVQTLLPFDINHIILQSVKKTNRIVFLDEDVPGGAAAYMFQQVFEGQDLFRWLDSEPKTITAKAHRSAYGSDGDYFCKPNAEEVFEVIYTMMSETDPSEWAPL